MLRKIKTEDSCCFFFFNRKKPVKERSAFRWKVIGRKALEVQREREKEPNIKESEK